MEFIIFALAFVILVPLVLYFILAPVFKEKRISNNVRNQDTFSREYLFKVNYSKNEFLQKVNIPNANDILEFTFDSNPMTITFFKYGANIPYTVFIKEFDGGCYIKLSKNALIGDRSNILYQINEFMIKEFNAELLPYEEYKDIVT